MRKQMSPAERVHLVPILQDAAGWKKVEQFAAPDDAYIVVLDSGGQIKWRTHGTVPAEAYSQLKRFWTNARTSHKVGRSQLVDATPSDLDHKEVDMVFLRSRRPTYGAQAQAIWLFGRLLGTVTPRAGNLPG
jgi:hypothetical protein